MLLGWPQGWKGWGGGLQGGQPAPRALSLCVPEEGKTWEGRIRPASIPATAFPWASSKRAPEGGAA